MSVRFDDPSSTRRLVRISPGERPILCVVVDTEEEFDWDGEFHRGATSVEAMASIGRGQEVCEEFGIRPVYVVDYPVAEQEKGYRLLREFVEAGRAEVGAHLHPWVSPPFEEEVSRRNSFAGNLPASLEAAKLRRLADQIESSFGVRPVTYKAGRYGIGPNTTTILEQQGFEVDLSACPPFDFRDEGGPDFSAYSCDPYWFGRERRLMALPNTGAYVGFIGRGAHRLYRGASRPGLRGLRLTGLLARAGAVERLRLSPEGFQSADLRRLTECLLARGARVFTFSFHSPSLEPGHTPYVRHGADLQGFLETCRRYFAFFLGELGGISLPPTEIKRRLESVVDVKP